MTTTPPKLGLAAKLAIIGLASFVVMIASAHLCDKSNECKKETAWAVACSVISLAFVIGLLGLWKAGVLSKPVLPLGAHGEMVTSALLLLWWGAGVGVLTFKEPFKNAGNGFFGAWISFLTALHIAFSLIPQVDSAYSVLAQNGSDLMYVLFASIVLTVQASYDCGRDECYVDSDGDKQCDGCSGKQLWGLLLGIFSTVFCALLIAFRSKIPAQVATGLSALLAAMWLAGWLPLTIWGPYIYMQNGYLAVCAGFFFSFKLAASSFDVGRYVNDLGHGDASSPPPASAPPGMCEVLL